MTLKKAVTTLDDRIPPTTGALLQTADGVCYDHLEATKVLIRDFSINSSKQSFLDNVVRLIQQESQCEFVGIRVLNEDGYIPYQSYTGFTREFWESENMIQITKEDCTCTRIVSGKLLPFDYAIINEQGTLCCGDLKEFADSLSPDEAVMYRGACINAGYRSISVIPIIYNQKTLGIIHLADYRPNQIRSEAVDFLESIAPLIGGFLAHNQIELHLKQTETSRAIMESIVTGISNLAYVVNLDTHELIYTSQALQDLWGPKQAKQTCYEFFGCQSACPDCPHALSTPPGLPISSWEFHDKKHDRYYLAEAKEVNWLEGLTARIAFILDITQQRKAEQALKDTNATLAQKVYELQKTSAELHDEIIERQASQEALLEKNKLIHSMAFFDSLTGLANRAHFNERLEADMKKARAGKQRGVIFSLDLDDLKMVNDTFGHNYGDALILTAGSRIVKAVGLDAFVARIGGDEFVVLLSGEDSQTHVEMLANRLLTVLCEEVEVMGTQFHLSASIGIALYPQDGTQPEELFKNADNALYTAKNSGKHCWRQYEPAMQAEAYNTILLSNSLRHAIERNEFLVYYQPQINLLDGRVTGFEALLRWNSSEHGFVSPARFIPMAEQSGVIHAIGKWVLHEACQFAHTLHEQGWNHLQIAVNVSPHQLCSQHFLDIIRETLRKTAIAPQQLELEITENVLIASLEDSTNKLKELEDIGITLALDDFGTGYSSLTYLQRLPMNTLKIDKSFIDRILSDGADKPIVETIIQLAHGMDMVVVAEGVETAEQLDYLRRCHCDKLQGYLISRPLPQAAALQFLQTYTPASRHS